MLSKNIKEQCPREGGSGREKPREETGVFAASLQDFREGTVPSRASPRAGSRWGPRSQEPPCHANKPPKERSPSILIPWGDRIPPASSAGWRKSSKQSCGVCGAGAAHPGCNSAGGQGVLLPQCLPHQDSGASGRFCCSTGLTHTARRSHTGQPSICRWEHPGSHHHLHLPSQAPRDGEGSSAAGEASQERGAEMVKSS